MSRSSARALCLSICVCAPLSVLLSSNCSPAVAQIDVELPNASPSEALQAVSRSAGLSLVSLPVVGEGRPFSLQGAGVADALTRLTAEYGLEVTVWRDILVAQPGDAATPIAARLRDSLSEDEADFLFREPDDGSYEAPGFELIITAIKTLATEGHTQANRPFLERVALWRAGPELQQHIANFEEALAGEVLVEIAPPAQWEKDRDDPCDFHLVLHYTRSGDPQDVLGSQKARFHGHGYDRFADTLKEERAIIGREELVKRLLARARAEQDSLGGHEAFDLPANLEYTTTSLGALASHLIQGTGLRVEVEEALSDRPLIVAVSDAPTGDVLQAAARLAGGVVLATPDEGVYRLATPAVTLERLQTALPLPVWGVANLTSIEADLWCQEHTESAWGCLTPEMQAELREHPVSLAELPAEVHALALYHFARDLRRWTNNLPLRSGPVPLWLYERTDDPHFRNYELRAPGGSERINGIGYLLLKGELRGDPVFRFPAGKEEGER